MINGIRLSPDERRHALRDASYANSTEEAAAIWDGDQREWARADPLVAQLVVQANTLNDAVTGELDAATDAYVEVRTWIGQIRDGKVEASAETAAQLQRYRGALGLSIASLEAYIGQLEHSAAKCAAPWETYCDLVSKYPQINRG